MTNEQIKELDALFQNTILRRNPTSWLGGKAEVVHHFITKGAGGLSTRWFLPNGIPLTNEQHQDIHGKNRNQLEEAIQIHKGNCWRKILTARANVIAKDVSFEKVKGYLLGTEADYL